MLDTVVAGIDGNYARLRSPGRIQGFGVLLAVHPRTLRVLSASENTGAVFGIAHADILGRSLPEIIATTDAVAEIREAAGSDFPTFQNPILVDIGGRRFDAVLHAHDGLIFAEFEPLAPGAPTRADLDRLSDTAIAGMMVPDTLEGLLAAGPAAIRAATDFDRVLLYKFDEAYRGQVVGEALRPGVDSFMGLFFPESDIGGPARQLYEQNFCRYIPSLDSPSFRVLPSESPLTGRTLDMSHAVLRGVAPCHIEYLVNMGVAASMSYSIVAEGRLWGLFACHHYEPAKLSYVQRLVCEQIAMLFVAKLEEIVNPATQAAEMEQRRDAVLGASPVCKANPLRQTWQTKDENALLHLVEADSAAIYIDGEVGKIGAVPDFSDLHDYITTQPEAFARLLRMYDDDGLFYTSSIASVLPFGDKMRERGSGVMVVPLSREGKRYLIWFRPELVVKATWGGNPSDRHGTDPNARFSPRRSFAAWKEDIRDRAAPWTAGQIANAVALRDHIMANSG
jgi:light-regulated signal transduction histidine kinase (bacteriophytochrome)